MKSLNLFFALFLCLNFFVSGQDIHFSQYYAAPVFLNPALTANVNGVFRAAANYRNQWFLIPTQNLRAPYQTIQGSFDMPILRDRLGNNGFGFGINVYHDRAGNGVLTTTTALASIAYHQAVDRFGRSRFSLGLQAGVTNKAINLNNLLFESQFDQSIGFWNENLSNQESPIDNTSIIYPTVNVGVLWASHPKNQFRYYLGYAANNVSRPRESFLNDPRNRLQIRHVVHAGMEIFTSRDMNFSFSPMFLFMIQNIAQAYQAGLGFNYEHTDELGFFGSVSNRFSPGNPDAVIVGFGVEFYNVRLGISYDFNYSGLRTATRAQGAAEVGAVYIFRKEKTGPIQYSKYCPVF
ncbi:MAG: PorP/SprF family type IX secretion system membrane protein [Chitinophagales bacterium]|nr:PorP/SprF family type IX secretion system membrane protein [Chitinophagales bacterium]MDW8274369.1 PorP/SprF family type IX secretion system membrane protein [Chitinophagales bacterium]